MGKRKQEPTQFAQEVIASEQQEQANITIVDEGEQLAMPGFETELTSAEEIKRQLPVVQFRMDFLRSPEDALIRWNGLPHGGYEKWFSGHLEKLVAIVAEETGADPRQIADKETRTPEQQRLLTEAAAKITMARIDAFFDSAYMDALGTLETLKGVYDDPGEIDFYTDNHRFNPESEYISVKEQAVLYYFALHDDLMPTEEKPLTNAQQQELIGIYHRLDEFYAEQTGNGSYDPEQEAEILFAFIEKENPSPETAESIAAKLPLVQGIRPSAHTMPNNALMNTLQQKQAINAGAFDLVVANEVKPSETRKGRKEITAYTMISYDPGENGNTITVSNLSEYERQVSDAIISLWIEADKEGLPPFFTADMIFRAMPGGSDKASPQQKGAITKTIEKFRRLHIYVDATAEAMKRGLIKEGKKYIFDEYYLNVRRHTVQIKNGGTIVQGYEVLSQPVMLTYSRMTNQLLTVAAKYLAIEKIKQGRPSGELVTMTADRQAMTGYMLRRIAIMKHDRETAKDTFRKYESQRKKDPLKKERPLQSFFKQSNIILFETLFAETGTETANRKQTMLNRNFCFDVLDYWKATNYIKGYVRQEKGRSITGMEILF